MLTHSVYAHVPSVHVAFHATNVASHPREEAVISVIGSIVFDPRRSKRERVGQQSLIIRDSRGPVADLFKFTEKRDRMYGTGNKANAKAAPARGKCIRRSNWYFVRPAAL